MQAPVNTLPPWIDPGGGAIGPGTELHCEEGTWDNDTVESPQVRTDWFVEGEEVLEDSSSYVTTADDAGKDITCEVAMNNGAAVTEAISSPVHFGPATASLSPATLDFGEREVAVLRRLGFLGALAAEAGYANALSFRRSQDDRFRVPRFGFPDELPQMIQYVSGVERFKQLLRGNTQ